MVGQAGRQAVGGWSGRHSKVGGQADIAEVGGQEGKAGKLPYNISSHPQCPDPPPSHTHTKLEVICPAKTPKETGGHLPSQNPLRNWRSSAQPKPLKKLSLKVPPGPPPSCKARTHPPTWPRSAEPSCCPLPVPAAVASPPVGDAVAGSGTVSHA